jgi:hypothetical protein
MTNQSDEFNPFEAQLEAAFRPVQPSNKYVQTIRQRISFKAPVEMSRRLSNRSSLLFVLGGVLSFSLLTITVVRTIFYFVNRSKI